MKSLDELRAEIDAVDAALAPLLVRRMEAAAQIAEVKRAEGIAVYDAKREAQVLQKVTHAVPEPDSRAIRRLYATLFDASRLRQLHLLGQMDTISEPAERDLQAFPVIVHGGVDSVHLQPLISANWEGASSVCMQTGAEAVLYWQSGKGDYLLLDATNGVPLIAGGFIAGVFCAGGKRYACFGRGFHASALDDRVAVYAGWQNTGNMLQHAFSRIASRDIQVACSAYGQYPEIFAGDVLYIEMKASIWAAETRTLLADLAADASLFCLYGSFREGIWQQDNMG